MAKPWIKLWKNDLLSSMNYQNLSIYEKGIYNQLLLLCRDDDYAGQFCYPNGNPNTIDDIIRAMHPAERERTDLAKNSIDNFIKVGLLFWNNDKRLEIRKYAVKTGQVNCATTGQPLESISDEEIKTCKSSSESDTESYSDKEADNPPTPLSAEDEILNRLIKAQHKYCPADTLGHIRDTFQSAINAGIKAKDIEMAIETLHGKRDWQVIKSLEPKEVKGTEPGWKPVQINNNSTVKCAKCNDTHKVHDTSKPPEIIFIAGVKVEKYPEKPCDCVK